MVFMSIGAPIVQALGRQHDLSETCPRLEQWLLDETMSPSLSFLEATERRIVAAFVGHSRDRGGLGWRIATFFFSAGNEQSAGVQNSLCLQPDSTLDEIQRARLAAHVAAAFVSAGPTSPMAFFSVVATAPELLREGTHSWRNTVDQCVAGTVDGSILMFVYGERTVVVSLCCDFVFFACCECVVLALSRVGRAGTTEYEHRRTASPRANLPEQSRSWLTFANLDSHLALRREPCSA